MRNGLGFSFVIFVSRLITIHLYIVSGKCNGKRKSLDYSMKEYQQTKRQKQNHIDNDAVQLLLGISRDSSQGQQLTVSFNEESTDGTTINESHSSHKNCLLENRHTTGKEGSTSQCDGQYHSSSNNSGTTDKDGRMDENEPHFDSAEGFESADKDRSRNNGSTGKTASGSPPANVSITRKSDQKKKKTTREEQAENKIHIPNWACATKCITICDFHNRVMGDLLQIFTLLKKGEKMEGKESHMMRGLGDLRPGTYLAEDYNAGISERLFNINNKSSGPWKAEKDFGHNVNEEDKVDTITFEHKDTIQRQSKKTLTVYHIDEAVLILHVEATGRSTKMNYGEPKRTNFDRTTNKKEHVIPREFLKVTMRVPKKATFGKLKNSGRNPTEKAINLRLFLYCFLKDYLQQLKKSSNGDTSKVDKKLKKLEEWRKKLSNLVKRNYTFEGGVKSNVNSHGQSLKLLDNLQNQDEK